MLSLALILGRPNAFESVLNKKIMRHLSAHNLLSDCRYGFRKDQSTGDLAFLTESWSSSFRDFDETFAVGLDISKAFDRLWDKSLISKLASHGFYPSPLLLFLYPSSAIPTSVFFHIFLSFLVVLLSFLYSLSYSNFFLPFNIFFFSCLDLFSICRLPSLPSYLLFASLLPSFQFPLLGFPFLTCLYTTLSFSPMFLLFPSVL